LAIALTGLALGFYTTWADLIGVWKASQTYQYSFIVVPTVVYLLHIRRGEVVALQPCGSSIGVLVAGACGLLWLAADLAGAEEGTHLAVVLAILAVVWATVGTCAFKKILPPLSLLFFLVPTGHQLLPWLRDLTVAMAVIGPDVFEIPATINGYTFSVAEQSYIVIADCAGLGELLVTLFLAAAFGLMIYRTLWKTLALMLIAGATAIIANGLRVNAIVLVNYWSGSVMDMSAHRAVGWCTIAAVVVLIFLIARRFDDRSAVTGRQHVAHSRRVPSAKASACGLLAVGVMIGVPLGWPIDTGKGTIAATPELSNRLGIWRLTSETPEWAPQAAGADQVMRGVYSDGKTQVAVFVAVASSPRSEVSGPSLKLLTDDTWWLPSTGRRVVCDDVECWPVKTLVLDYSNGPRIQTADILTVLNGASQQSATTLRLKRAWHILAGQQAKVAVFALATEGEDRLPASKAASLFTRIVARTFQNDTDERWVMSLR
jgi:exosortase